MITPALQRELLALVEERRSRHFQRVLSAAAERVLWRSLEDLLLRGARGEWVNPAEIADWIRLAGEVGKYHVLKTGHDDRAVLRRRFIAVLVRWHHQVASDLPPPRHEPGTHDYTEPLVTISEVAAMLHPVSPHQIRRMINNDEVEYVRLGSGRGRLFVPLREVNRLREQFFTSNGYEPLPRGTARRSQDFAVGGDRPGQQPHRRLGLVP